MNLEQQLKETKEELEKLKSIVKEQDEKLGAKPKILCSERDSTTDYNSSDCSNDDENKTKHKKKRKSQKSKEESLKKVLRNHQNIIKQLAGIVLEKNPGNESLRHNLNDLSSRKLSKAIKQTNRLAPCSLQGQPDPPKISENECNILELREHIQLLKDLFRSRLTGSEQEDLQGLLMNVTKLTEKGQLDLDQFYSLLLSRLQNGTDLYNIVSDHHKWKSSPTQLYREIIPLFSMNKNFISSLNKMESYKLNPESTASNTLSAVRRIANEIADATTCENRSDYVLQLVRNKIMILFPQIAPTLLEKEKMYKPRSMGEFTSIFLELAPLIDNRKRVKFNVTY